MDARLQRNTVFLCMVLALWGAAAWGGATYSVAPLPSAGGVTEIHDLNDRGDVGGAVAMPGDVYGRAALWRRGRLQVLTGEGISGAFVAQVNEAGVAVGRTDSGGDLRAFRWFGGRLELLAPLSGDFAAGASGINRAGVIVGHSTGSLPRPAAWAGDAVFDLNELAHPGSLAMREAVGINDRNGISCNLQDRQHACLFQRGTVIDLGTLGGAFSEASAIDGEGRIVGHSAVSPEFGGGTHAFLWDRGTMTDLGTLGGDFSYAHDINDRGQIVGTSWLGAGTDRHAVLWLDLQPVDLNARIPAASGWILMSADAVNDWGVIAGLGTAPGSNNPGNDPFLLTPVDLVLEQPQPGRAGVINTLQVSGLPAGAHVVLYRDDMEGLSMPDGCGGRSLALAAPRAVASAVADGQGLAVFELPVPAALAGRTVRLQALADCLFSDVLVHTF